MIRFRVDEKNEGQIALVCENFSRVSHAQLYVCACRTRDLERYLLEISRDVRAGLEKSRDFLALRAPSFSGIRGVVTQI